MDAQPLQQPLTLPLAFTRPDTHPLVLDAVLEKKYSVDWLLWEPETVWESIKQDFKLKTEISKNAKYGIQCVKTIHANDSFFEDWQTTNWCTLALDGYPPDFEFLQEAYPGQILHAVSCAKILRGDMKYADEVQSWMAACFLNFGMLLAIEPVTFIQDEIAHVEAHCPKCSNVEWAIGLTECPNCGTPRSELRLRPKHEWEDLVELWNLAKRWNPEQLVLPEDRRGIQIARAVAATQYSKDRLAELDQQLKELGYGART